MSGTRVHATTVAVQGEAVLLMGPSGSGKSDLALRLIDRGAALVSDDYTMLRVDKGRLIASPPETIAGLIEVRGLGIVAAPFVAGVAAVLVVRLGEPVERMPAGGTKTVIAGVALPEIALAAFEASTAIKVELALDRAREGA